MVPYTAESLNNEALSAVGNTETKAVHVLWCQQDSITMKRTREREETIIEQKMERETTELETEKNADSVSVSRRGDVSD